MTTVPDRKSSSCLTEAMVIWDGIIKNGDVVDVLPDTFSGNNRPTGTGLVKKLEKCNNW